MHSWQLFIRHAHRDTDDRESDNGLSEKGLKQGVEMIRYFARFGEDRKPLKILSSPKLRCRQTAEFASQWAGVEVEIDERLDEQRRGEGNTNFLKRVSDFFEWSQTQTRICSVSHGDLLPLVAELAGASGVEIRKGDLFWIVDGQVEDLNGVHSSGNKRR